MSAPTVSPCPCIEPGTVLHRRTFGHIDVVWTDTPGCPCAPGAVIPHPVDESPFNSVIGMRNLAGDITRGAYFMQRIEDTDPGSAERAALHGPDRCGAHDCRISDEAQQDALDFEDAS